MCVCVCAHREAIGVSSTALEAATQRSLTAADVSKAVGAVGGDGYKLAADVDTSGLAIDQGRCLQNGAAPLLCVL